MSRFEILAKEFMDIFDKYKFNDRYEIILPHKYYFSENNVRGYINKKSDLWKLIGSYNESLILIHYDVYDAFWYDLKEMLEIYDDNEYIDRLVKCKQELMDILDKYNSEWDVENFNPILTFN